MRKLLKELFYIPKYGKIPEKAMVLRVAMIATTMVACLAAMGFSAYAYFSHNVSSGTNVIQAARFEASILVQYTENDTVITLEPDGDNAYVLQKDKTYTVTLKPMDDCNAQTGFVIISADHSAARYHTQQLYIGDPKTATPVIFKISVTEETAVKFLSSWGTSSYYATHKDVDDPTDPYIRHGETVVLQFPDQSLLMQGPQPAPTEPTQPTEDQTSQPTQPTEPAQPAYALNLTDVTAYVGWKTTIKLLDTATNTPVTGLTWHISEPDYITLTVLEDGVRAVGTAGTVGVEGVHYGRVWCEYEGVTYTCIVRIKEPPATEPTTP